MLHLSDVHVDIPMSAMPWREMLNKRLLGAANLVLRRHAHFADAREKLAALARLAQRERVDLVICTGDYTALGTGPEIVAAREAIDALTHAPQGFVTVPGNHDVYMPDALADSRFEHSFGEFLKSDWPEACVDGPWPVVKLCGDSVAVIAVNSARPNPELWKSNGRVPEAQLAALARLLDDPRLQNRFVFIATHYAPRRADGTPDKPLHGMENADALLAICAKLERGALLHGHIHWRFHLQLAELRARIFGSGSTTCSGREGFWLFEVDAAQTRAIPGGFRNGDYRLL
ncbi:MAG TPA: metallophosphoesterase, partial [Polyangiales bacterium]|nr:metallophosphoesterase [Polyangiales bacterium]